jgi:hypothetical protein
MMHDALHGFDICFKMFSARFGSSSGLNLDLMRPMYSSSEFARLTEVANFAVRPERAMYVPNNDELGDVRAQQIRFESLLTRFYVPICCGLCCSSTCNVLNGVLR